jgi:hypothetical protein
LLSSGRGLAPLKEVSELFPARIYYQALLKETKNIIRPYYRKPKLPLVQ